MNRQRGIQPRPAKRLWVTFRPVIIFLISVALVGSAALFGYRMIWDRFLLPVDKNDNQEIIIEVKNGLGKSGIAKALYGENEENRVIRSTLTFKIYVDFVGKANKLRAGTYALRKDMTIPEIVNKLASGDGSVQVAKQFTIIEGMSVEDIAAVLTTTGILESDKTFLELCRTGEGFESVHSGEKSSENRKYVLEGYLFPDTYKVFQGTAAPSIIQLMVSRFNEVLTNEDVERAEELGMTVDEVITLASLIEKEAKTADFAKVSAVFHNRLKEDIALESDVPIKYALGLHQIYLSRSALDTDSPYNTHLNKGLPVGPVCNPGLKAIQAALWPDEEYREEKYLFFTLMDPDEGELAFSKTYEEHEAIVEQYRDAWIAYDAQSSMGIVSPTPSLPGSPSPSVSTSPSSSPSPQGQ